MGRRDGGATSGVRPPVHRTGRPALSRQDGGATSGPPPGKMAANDSLERACALQATVPAGQR
ncbi:MAG TPA: hypothetical protein VH599_21640 [Ktedonobacterales bacterium]